ncbi:MAG TPA: AlkA N-terminal domain-containing protein [Gemmatimonadales bacterium]|nr:AlkA N-terminal domain-containing protein [Gemmatimonadales bacterium]
MLAAEVCQRAVRARDARFDGMFFVGVTTTRVYCRPVCPSRRATPKHRRFFDSAAAAEHAGFRPCLRCRPELAPGRALVDAVPRLASVAAYRIAAGALNGRGVAQLASDLGVSERHLRRALRHEIGVAPLELAQTHRLLLAKRLLADTDLPITRVAFASGFQSLRRFNAVFRAHYRLRPSALRPRPRTNTDDDALPLTLAYRPPLAWRTLTAMLVRDAWPGIDRLHESSYARTVRIAGHSGVIVVNEVADTRGQLHVSVSPSLVPVLMPLVARLRRVLDLDAEPSAIDAHLTEAGLGGWVERRPGLRVPGMWDGFEATLRVLLPGQRVRRRILRALGEPIATAVPGLTHLAPTATRVAAAGAPTLRALGVPSQRVAVIIAVARALQDGALALDPGVDVAAARGGLQTLGVPEPHATRIIARALYWPDAFAETDRALRRATGATSLADLRARAERWRPWRAYAALHLTLPASA